MTFAERSDDISGAETAESVDVPEPDDAALAQNAEGPSEVVDDAGVGSSPYSTGGGGVSFAHRVAAVYLARMLTGQRMADVAELPVSRISFQTGPTHPVDDLLVVATDGKSEITVAIACRATPNFVKSHEDTVKLVGSMLKEVEKFDSATHRVAVAVGGTSNQWQQLATVCAIAEGHADPESFEASMDVDGRWSSPVRSRWQHLLKMTEAAADESVSPDDHVRLAWRLLSRLRVLQFAVQNPDESDRTAAACELDRVAAESADGVAVRDRLEVEATRYDRIGAVVDLNLLRRDVHALLHSPATRRAHAWGVLANHREFASGAVRGSIGGGSIGDGLMSIPFASRRKALAAEILSAGANPSSLMLSGESGTGKSALMLSTIADLETADPAGFEAVVVNFRGLPQTGLELDALLGMSMTQVLAELSAPSRLLVIDAADGALERSSNLLTHLVLAAAAAGVGIAAVTSDSAAAFVQEQLIHGGSDLVSEFTMDALSDEDVSAVSEHFPLLRGVLRDLPRLSLLRRLVVLDLLARTGLRLENSLGEWGCLQIVWAKIVRGEGSAHAGSAEAREQTILAVSAATLQLPDDQFPVGRLDPAAIDSLRRDHLLAPASPYLSQPQFAHDEVRRYATAILLIRAQSATDILNAAGVPRWAMSAATLAIKGQLLAPGVAGPRTFAQIATQFRHFADQHGARWADIPIEAVLETPVAYESVKHGIEDANTKLALGDVVRVVQQRHKISGILDPVATAPVIRILSDEDQPWAVSKKSYELLASWLQSLVILEPQASNPLRVALRKRLLAFWDLYPPREVSEAAYPRWATSRRRSRALDYHLSDANFVESLALLGPDSNDVVAECLKAMAADAPGRLAPAVDSPLSARALVLKDPELLATLIEAYYIDEDDEGFGLRDGIRDHAGRWTTFGPPFAEYYFGGFWSLFQTAPPKTSVRVLNNILNHAARRRVQSVHPNLFEGLREGVNTDEAEHGAMLNLNGTPRLYIGDGHVWSWYRGSSVGPRPATSALLAMERVADGWLEIGAHPARVIEMLLYGCENLAVPGMLFGLLVRHLEALDTELDPFVTEPLVWQLEFSRSINENFGLRAPTEGLKNQDRRHWSAREASVHLVSLGGQDRVGPLKALADKLVENGDRLGIDQSLTKNWAASLDLARYQVTKQDGGYYVEVVPPPEVKAVLEQHAADQENMQSILRLQNRYWGSRKHDSDYQAPSTSEIAKDLAAGRVLLESDIDLTLNRPKDAVAHVVRMAVERAAVGEMDALGDEADFATRFVVEIAQSFADTEDPGGEGYFDASADRAVALALPAFLLPSLNGLLEAIGASVSDVASAGLAMARKAPLETKLYLARGCDVLWAAPCDDPCAHTAALRWLVETARSAEIGPWDASGQRRPRVFIEDDVIERLQVLDAESIDIGVLDPVIRGLGSAAAVNHCCTETAATLLAGFLDVQRRAMVAQEDKGWTADDGGRHTLVSARALLNVFATIRTNGPILNHIDVLRADAKLLTNILHGFAGVAAESERLASAARGLWPSLIGHALRYVNDDPNPYGDHHWGDWAAAGLLPEPSSWSQGLYSEIAGVPIDWVRAEDLLDQIDGWLPAAHGEARCVDALIRILRRLPLAEQARRGLTWVADLCIRDGKAVVVQSSTSDEWLKAIRSTAEETGSLEEWQLLVDSMVVAGNESLAPYSR